MDPDTSSPPPAKSHRYRRHRGSRDVVGALIFIAMGGILLMNNLGVLPWSIWSELWRFWPVILVLVGLQLLLGRSWYAQVFMFILGAVVIGFILTLILTVPSGQFNRWLEHFSSQSRSVKIQTPGRFDH